MYTDSDRTLRSTRCLPGYCDMCEAGEAPSVSDELVPGRTYSCCTENRPAASSNPLCGQCSKPDYYVSDRSCVYCVETNGGLAFAVVMLTWLYVTLFHSLSQINRSDTRIFLNLVQFVSIYFVTRAGSLTTWLQLL